MQKKEKKKSIVDFVDFVVFLISRLDISIKRKKRRSIKFRRILSFIMNGNERVKISRMDGKQVGKRHPFAELKHAGNGTNGRGSATIVSIVTHVYNCLPAALKRVGIRREPLPLSSRRNFDCPAN